MAAQNKVNLITYIITLMNNNIDLLDIVDEDQTGSDLSIINVRNNKYYRIKDAGTSDFTSIGSPDSDEGTVFLVTNAAGAEGTGVVNKVEPIYGSNPFIPNIFKTYNDGRIMELLNLSNIPISEQIDPRRFIMVDISNAELEKENIFNVDVTLAGEENTVSIPLESWLGTVGVQLLLFAEDVGTFRSALTSVYGKTYSKIIDMHEDQFKNEVTTNSSIIDDGTERSLEFTSPIIIDVDDIVEINGHDYKKMFFSISINISNKGILRASRRRIQYRTSADGISPEVWEEIPLGVAVKDFKYTKLHQDDTNSGESVRKSVADIADRELAFNIVYDSDKQLIQDLEEEIEKSRFNDDEHFYNFKLIKQLPDGTLNEFKMKTSLASLIENNNSNFTIYLLSFLEVE